MMTELGLCAEYGAYLDAVPAPTLAEVSFVSLCGLHRRLRGALIGQFATVELTSSPGSHRLVRAMRRLGCSPAAIEFYAEHMEADAVHEQLVRHGVIAPLLAAEPELAVIWSSASKPAPCSPIGCLTCCCAHGPVTAPHCATRCPTPPLAPQPSEHDPAPVAVRNAKRSSFPYLSRYEQLGRVLVVILH
jgi:hypothetical protein